MFEITPDSVSLMLYREADAQASLSVSLVELPNQSGAAAIQPITEDEVAQRVAAAVECVRDEERTRYDEELIRSHDACASRMAEALLHFTDERARYFERIEGEVVRLALSIARKILQRESHVDPSLLGALVRIALERMQSGPSVRIRIPPNEGEHWRAMSRQGGSAAGWDVVEDSTLLPGDCMVETQSGSANYGFEAQISAVEEVFTHLLAKRPGA